MESSNPDSQDSLVFGTRARSASESLPSVQLPISSDDAEKVGRKCIVASLDTTRPTRTCPLSPLLCAPVERRIGGFHSAEWPISLNAAARYLPGIIGTYGSQVEFISYRAIRSIRRVRGFNPGTRLKTIVAVEAQQAIVNVLAATLCLVLRPWKWETSASEVQSSQHLYRTTGSISLHCLKPLWRSAKTWRHFSKIRPSKLPSSALRWGGGGGGGGGGFEDDT
ncbi:hypothetical protein CCMA1212_007289 [Trichoderma ghanense]|uniref:Uncharacterized protein n=1 Tax=Trichoderma ghanense TaxID=65468 RepID=A0ABY2GXH7_9HYPO